MKRLLLLLLVLSFGLTAQPALHTVNEIGQGHKIVPAAAYPSYDLYEELMEQFARRFPRQCALEEWGTLPSGRKILALRITNDPWRVQARPRVLCTAAMHGDELAGYWVLLRLAEDLLLNNPGNLLNDIELYINPLANPDGAYMAGNHSLNAARRGNFYGVDLNRNYPDPDDGEHPDGYDYQSETRIFMEVAASHGFDLAINFHGGAELFNYPWDTFRTRHADTDWWRRVSRDFARRAQEDSPASGYFKDRFNGVTNGHDWYPIAGSRQDYMNYYHRTREATVEITSAKRYPARELPELWTNVRGALLGFLNEARYGIHGKVTDAVTGSPLRAHISIPGHDRLQSSVYSETAGGDFYRFLAPGTYRIVVEANGYLPRSVIVKLGEGEQRKLHVALEPDAQPAEARR